MKLLHPERLLGVRQEVVDFCQELVLHVKFDVLVVSGKRSDEQQKALFAQGRTAPGHIVTNAVDASCSAHGRGCAVDLAPSVVGAIPWDDKAKFLEIGEYAEAHGLVWGGRWKLADLGHCELEGWRDFTIPEIVRISPSGVAP